MAPSLTAAPTPADAPPAAADEATRPEEADEAGRHDAEGSALAGATLIGSLVLLAGLAVWGLGRKSLWVDESISLGATNELVATWKGTGGTMALYYALLAPWSQASTSAAWLRGLSVLFAVASLLFVWRAARRAFGPTVAALATVLTAGSYLVVRYAQEARSYALVLLLAAVSWSALVRAIRADEDGDDAAGRRAWIVFGVASVLAPLAHGLAVLQFFGQLAFLACSPDRRRWLDRVKGVGVGVVAATVVLVLAGASDVASWIPPLNRTQIADLAAAFTGPSLGIAGSIALLAAAGLGAAVCVQRSRSLEHPTERWLALLPVCWALVPVAILFVASILRPYLLARYVMASAPGVALLWAFAITGASGRLRPVRSLLVGLPIVGLLAAAQLGLHQEEGDGWRGAAVEVVASAQPGDGLVLPNPSVRSAFEAAWLAEGGTPSRAPEAFSPVEPLGEVRRFYLIREPSTLAAEVAGSDLQRIWVVDQRGAGFDDTLTPFLDDPAIAEAFEVTDRVEADGGVQLVLLERS